MAHIGIMGTGRMAVRLARILLDNGHRVMLGSRTPSPAKTLARVLDERACVDGTYQRRGKPAHRDASDFHPRRAVVRRRHCPIRGTRVITVCSRERAFYQAFFDSAGSGFAPSGSGVRSTLSTIDTSP